MHDYNKLDLLDDKSDAVKEVVGKVPPFYIRWGLLVNLIFVAAMVFFASVVTYPDMLVAPVIIIAENPPVELIAETDGRVFLNVSDQELVSKGAILAVISNAANLNDVLMIKGQFADIRKQLDNRIIAANIVFKPNLSLGMIQNDYEAFVKLYSEYSFYVKNAPLQSQIKNVSEKIAAYEALKLKYADINAITDKDFDLNEKNYKRSQQLKNSKVISEKEFDDATRANLMGRKTKEQANLDLLATKEALTGLNGELVKLRSDNAQNLERYMAGLFETAGKVDAAINEWQRRYVLTASANGRVNLLNIWKSEQYIKKGDEVMVVTPAQQQHLLAKANVPIQNSGKLKIGQQVNIRLASHPSAEYGIIQGVLQSISSVPDRDNKYHLNISLPRNLNTTYNKQIAYSSSLKGTAEIITQKTTLLGRILNRFRDTFHNQYN